MPKIEPEESLTDVIHNVFEGMINQDTVDARLPSFRERLNALGIEFVEGRTTFRGNVVLDGWHFDMAKASIKTAISIRGTMSDGFEFKLTEKAGDGMGVVRTIWTDEQIAKMCEESKGKVIESLHFENEDRASGPYWVMTFTDGSETSFRFMAEIVRAR